MGLVALWPVVSGCRHAILTFHRIREPGRRLDPFDSCPSLDCHAFRAILEHAQGRFVIVPLAELVQRRSQSAPLAAITFDDGWRDNYDLALPVLREMRLPATVFVTTGKIGASEPFWQQVLGGRFREAARDGGPAAGRLREALGLAESTALDPRCYRATVAAWKQLSHDERDERLRRVAGGGSPEAAAPRCFLDEEEIREMARCGITFGSHTQSHTILTRQPPEAVEAELCESKRRLESILGVAIDMLAYPNGDCSPQVIGAARRAGYRIACTTCRGRTGPGDDPLGLPRIEPPWETAGGSLDPSLLRWVMR
jgi:peptidoglycan/xylan/chitin deacetylase (PgdA/CDA1 family)